MATYNAARCFGIKDMGAVAPGYRADLLVLDDLESVAVHDVYCAGSPAVTGGVCRPFEHEPDRHAPEWSSIYNSFCLDPLRAEDFHIEPKGESCRCGADIFKLTKTRSARHYRADRFWF